MGSRRDRQRENRVLEGKLPLPKGLAQTLRARADGRAFVTGNAEGHGPPSDFLNAKQLVGGTWGTRNSYGVGSESLWSPPSGFSTGDVEGGVACAESWWVRAPRDVGDASLSSSAVCEVSRPRRRLAAERRYAAAVGHRPPGARPGEGGEDMGRQWRRRRLQEAGVDEPAAAGAAIPGVLLGRPGRELLKSRSASATALKTLGPILALLLRLLHLGLGSGGCREDVPPSGRGKKEEKMKKHRRALALVSCLFLCSLVW
ncbi:hypothetical protein P7K49_037814 [Saguinus oedipus]|uniref:Uncharacterized protein n=1 Tax=Saguinus oedipus TaxID=9490 RepID=A0ABQ9TJ55_SAGOE|nr:hypothetical protein P7K49_037814 [Saguinus oedipus]